MRQVLKYKCGSEMKEMQLESFSTGKHEHLSNKSQSWPRAGGQWWLVDTLDIRRAIELGGRLPRHGVVCIDMRGQLVIARLKEGKIWKRKICQPSHGQIIASHRVEPTSDFW